MSRKRLFKKRLISALLSFSMVQGLARTGNQKFSGNPVFPGWYADPEGIIFDHTYWIYLTYSDDYGTPDKSVRISAEQLILQKNTINPQYLKQTFFNSFSSEDCNVVGLSEDLLKVISFPDGETYKEITPVVMTFKGVARRRLK